ncbi:MAG: hypothetical protein Q9225_005977 [Loekoesia sp. 1 TL-2023]
MATAGPELPPHLLAKRKRQQEAEEITKTPLQPQPQSRSSSPVSSNADDSKRRRTIGPAPPPASLSEKPSEAPSPTASSESNSDDDFGPSLPPANTDPSQKSQDRQNYTSPQAPQSPPKRPQREEWMLIPPTQDDWSSRVDPTKLRNRKFNTGKGAKAPPSSRGATGGGDSNALWTETPEQKRQRLEDEMMGVKKPAQLADGGGGEEAERGMGNEEERRETERRIREYNEKNRGASLYEEHKKLVPKDKEDDPSKRAFDKEKDMGGGMKIGHAKRKEMMSKAADFGSRFAGGKYL